VLGEGGPLVLVDEEGGVAVAEGQIEDGAQRRRRVLPGAGGDAADVALFHLEQLAGGGQRALASAMDIDGASFTLSWAHGSGCRGGVP
jgi:hypothetical protein